MVESGGKEVSQSEMMTGLKYAHTLIKELCVAQNDFIALYKEKFGIPEIKAYYNLPDESVFAAVSEYLTEDKLAFLYGLGKIDFHHGLETLEADVKQYLLEK